jgi:hypothetical protein
MLIRTVPVAAWVEALRVVRTVNERGGEKHTAITQREREIWGNVSMSGVEETLAASCVAG